MSSGGKQQQQRHRRRGPKQRQGRTGAGPQSPANAGTEDVDPSDAAEGTSTSSSTGGAVPSSDRGGTGAGPQSPANAGTEDVDPSVAAEGTSSGSTGGVVPSSDNGDTGAGSQSPANAGTEGVDPSVAAEGTSSGSTGGLVPSSDNGDAGVGHQSPANAGTDDVDPSGAAQGTSSSSSTGGAVPSSDRGDAGAGPQSPANVGADDVDPREAAEGTSSSSSTGGVAASGDKGDTGVGPQSPANAGAVTRKLSARTQDVTEDVDPSGAAEGSSSSSTRGAVASSDKGDTGAVPQSPAKAGTGTRRLSARMVMWERLYMQGNLASHLDKAAVQSCRCVCRDWRVMACDTATPDELWHRDLGNVRRAAAWKLMLLGGITLKNTPQDSYERLCNTESPWDSTIKRDINRTLPQEEMFREKMGKGQQSLFRLLRALASRLYDIGYCQSLNFIVATLIGIFPDDEATAFNCALALLLRHNLADMYRPKFPKLGVVVWQFDRIVEGFLPQVHTALVRHGVNSEYYAIQWFLTLFASDLPQHAVRRIWDRFLVAGWRVLVQVGLALLYTIQDVLPTLDTCEALSYLKKFTRARECDTEKLLEAAASFKVSHRMLSALEAAYNWEDDVQLLVIKDLDNGQVHWAVHAVPPPPPTAAPKSDDDRDDEDEPAIVIPRAFERGAESAVGPLPPGITPLDIGPEGSTAGDADHARGNILPFLLYNLDTSETSVIEEAWTQYTGDMDNRSKRLSGPVSVGPGDPAASPTSDEAKDGTTREAPLRTGCRSPMESASGSFWMQSVQQQAVRRLGQA